MARATKRAGVELGPVIIYVAIVVVVSAGIFTWDYAVRKGEEARRRPPDPQVVARNLVENIIGRGTVTSVKLAGGAVEIAFNSATYKPDQDKAKAREFLQAELELAVTAILGQMAEVQQVKAQVAHGGKKLAEGTGSRGQQKVQVTFDPSVQ
ncbi:MAG: hypothetical protein HY660_02640 [Armatimonadetes bacterium]|nr:hypothetical protein [Armatimonadota bacterium]